MKDDSLITNSAAMPNAANTVNTNVLDLKAQAVRPFTGQFRVKLSNTIATGANSKNVSYSAYGSNEANGANATLMRTWTVQGNAANHPASEREFQIDPNFDKRYLFFSATGEANGGDAGDGTFKGEIII